LRCQSRNLRTCKLEHKVFWEAFAITFDGLVQPKRGDPINAGEISIKNHFLATDFADEFVKPQDIGQLFPLFHAKRFIIS